MDGMYHKNRILDAGVCLLLLVERKPAVICSGSLYGCGESDLLDLYFLQQLFR
jgi:hypothetical protein